MRPLIFFVCSLAILSLPCISFATEADDSTTIESTVSEPRDSSLNEDYQAVLQLVESKKLWDNSHWQKLLHFEFTNLGFYESQVDGPAFFLASDGNENFKSELYATLESFWKTAKETEEKSTICRFPARYMWLKKTLRNQAIEWPDRSCERYDRYRAALSGEGVSLVFSSYFLNSPSSTFGHTFLRINKAPAADGMRYELLDYSINFAANPDTGNALLYAWRGAFGGFKGVFSSMPYYYKVREYVSSESRDLWEYELNFTKEEVDFLIAHSWEMGPTWMNYWYLTENCSYHILSILEAAKPELELHRRTKKYVIPTDTLKTVWETPGLVRNFYYRPSIRSQFLHRLNRLGPDENQELRFLLDQDHMSKNFSLKSKQSQRDILDTALDFVDYKYAVDVQKPDTESAKKKNKLLAARSQNELKSDPLDIPINGLELPHFSHGSKRINLGYRTSQNSGNFYLFHYRFALHDQLDPVIGYPEYAEVKFWDMQFFYSEKRKKFELEDFTLMEVLSTTPSREYLRSISYQVKIGAERWYSENCFDCNTIQARGRIGYTFDLSQDSGRFLFLGLAAGAHNATALPVASQNFISYGPQARLRLRIEQNLLAVAEWTRLRYTFSDSKDSSMFTTGLQWSFGRDWGVRLNYRDYELDRSFDVNFLDYF